MRRCFLHFAAVSSCLLFLFVQNAQSDEPVEPSKRVDIPASETHSGVALERARERALLLHKVYAATLEVLHHRYFHGDRATVPARAMEDIFEEIKRDEQIEARWIAVSLKAMSIKHKPKSDFEHYAANEIKSGKRDVEQVDNGTYRRAFAIPLHGGCINCHDNSFAPSPTAKFAGLVISMPVRDADTSDEPTGTQ